ncbi:MAG: ATP-binding cassette domain-containing protein [Cyclobacteriaceae bacterium]
MFSLQLEKGGKKFQHEWVFRNLNLHLKAGMKLAVTGGNGSGKSTLIKCLSGQMPFTEGKIQFFNSKTEIPDSEYYKHLVISAPYLELPEEFSLKEFLHFHFQFKKISGNLSLNDLAKTLYLEHALNKPISYFSSGMKQRLKLGICFFSQAYLVLLDEPTSNLDVKGIAWYRDLIQVEGQNKCLIIASNDPREYDFCGQTIKMEDFKKKVLL